MNNTIIIAAMVAAALASVAPAARADTAPAAASASASAASDWQAYGSLGYNYLHGSPYNYSVDLGAVTGRLGLRYQQYVGVEAEVAAGVADQTIGAGKVSLDSQYAIYAVGYLPVSPRADLFARVGYGNAKLKASGNGLSVTASGDTWAYGVGGQYFLSEKDGVRADYTRYASKDTSQADVDSFSVSYVRKF
jgi:hypothetical protein